jgi:hypothetical protein
MGFFSKLFNRNPTAGWVDRGVTIDVDVATMKVMGHGFRSRGEVFSALGPADVWPATNGNGSLIWHRRGIALDFEHDQLTSLLITLLTGDDFPRPAGTQPFTERLLRAGTAINLRGGSTVQDVIAAMGSPTTRDSDEDETILCYDHGQIMTEFEIDHSAGLYAINMFTEGKVDESMKRGF